MDAQPPPMFVRAILLGPDGSRRWYDVAIADISAIEVASPGHAFHAIIGGLHAMLEPESYAVVHAAWLARRRSAAGR